MRNKKGQIFILSDKKHSPVQTGYFERLLCGDCEALLSKYETEFDKNWMKTIPSNISHLLYKRRGNVLTVTIPDYTKFKLFHLSILWRAAVSSFNLDISISLGEYERVIAQMILSGDPGQPGDFPFVGSLNYNDHGVPVPTVTPMAKSEIKVEGSDCYMLSYAYCDWIFMVGCPGGEWSRLEEQMRAAGVYLLLSTHFRDAKSFHLFVDRLRKSR